MSELTRLLTDSVFVELISPVVEISCSREASAAVSLLPGLGVPNQTDTSPWNLDPPHKQVSEIRRNSTPETDDLNISSGYG